MNMDNNESKGPVEPKQLRDGIPLMKHSELAFTNVPVFTCVVHLLRKENGTVQGRVANLPDLVCLAGSERDAMAKVVKEFKQRIGEMVESGSAIPWIEPPALKLSEEVTRLIPVHL